MSGRAEALRTWHNNFLVPADAHCYRKRHDWTPAAHPAATRRPAHRAGPSAVVSEPPQAARARGVPSWGGRQRTGKPCTRRSAAIRPPFLPAETTCAHPGLRQRTRRAVETRVGSGSGSRITVCKIENGLPAPPRNTNTPSSTRGTTVTLSASKSVICPGLGSLSSSSTPPSGRPGPRILVVFAIAERYRSKLGLHASTGVLRVLSRTRGVDRIPRVPNPRARAPRKIRRLPAAARSATFRRGVGRRPAVVSALGQTTGC